MKSLVFGFMSGEGFVFVFFVICVFWLKREGGLRERVGGT